MTDSKLPSSPKAASTPSLPAAKPDEFLPPIGRWTTVGGLVLLAGFVGAIGLSAVLPYKVVVKASASVRPTGELRLVQAATEGTVLRIAVQENEVVTAG